MLRTCLLALITAVPWSFTFATRYHVLPSANGSSTGLTWENAFTNLQEALGVVIPGDEIWVAAGQYRPTTGTSRTISFELRNGVDLFGGFSGTETALDQRDHLVNTTVLNGDIGEPGNSLDNSHSVVRANQLTSTTVLDGFRIVNGYSSSGSGYNGGGLRVTNVLSGKLIIRNCSFLNNYSGTYGGCIYMAAAKVDLVNCTFNNNQAGSGSGGAICNGNNNGGYSQLNMLDCVFLNNSARVGACIYNSVQFDQVSIDRCLFTGNVSENSIIDLDDFNAATLSNSLIAGNTVNGFSSNLLRVNSTSSTEIFTMTNCTVAHNFNLYTNTIQSEIIRFYDTNHHIKNSILFGNTAHAGRQVSTNANIAHSIVMGGHSGGTAILDLDPLFSDAYAGTPGSFDATTFDYTLSDASPAVNVGNNGSVEPASEFDLALLPRIQASTVDLGCYESDFTTAVPLSVAPSFAWHFDPSQGALVMALDQWWNGQELRIHDLHGRLVLSTIVQDRITPIHLRSGAYVASTTDLGTLKFVVP